ncbi:MAG: FdhF/YdeP family oxidoreductase [Planctomycetes bacterium]|nr:FdhF/YdeP family oxidoreductase [Planctomycetota bacterium]
MKIVRTGGGWRAIRYAWHTARKSGGVLRFFKAMSSRNACKTCALGMGGQRGGMVDEGGHFPEVCKKSMQAMAADMQDGITPAFFEKYGLRELAGFSSRELESLGRLVVPLFAGPDDDHYRPVTWDEALARCIDRLRKTPPDRSFFYVSGRSSNEAGFLLQLFARLYGTNNVNNCSYYCHQASGVGLTASLGSGTATIVLEDLPQSDLIFLIGGNPASNHPRLMRQLVKLRRRGGHVIVINPLVETGLVNFSVPSDVRSLLFGSDVASQYVQPHIGGDIALLTGIAKRIDEIGAVDDGFVEQCTEGWNAYRKFLRDTTWQTIVERSGVDRAAIERIAHVYAESRNVVFAWTMGITHHRHGVDNVRSIVNLALVRGMVGRPGAGLLPIRGHSNVQGVGSMGVTPALKKAVFERLESYFDVNLPTSAGLDTLGCIQAAHEGRLSDAWCLGGNLYGANPHAQWAAEALAKLDSMVYFSTTLNTGHIHGRAKETLILPMRVRDEESQPTTQESMFSFVRMSDGGPARHVGPRSEVEVIAHIARGVLGDAGPVDWKALESHRNIRQAIGKIVPGYEKIAKIDETRQEFHIAGRTFHEPTFPTPTGRAAFHTPIIPDLLGKPDELRLMTIRSEGQFNTVVYEEEDIYRNQERRDVILMNSADIERLGLKVDQQVTVSSAVGRMSNILVRAFDIRAGNAAMYYPEANKLVPAVADPQSKTPAFKAVAITITPEQDTAPVGIDLERAKTTM